MSKTINAQPFDIHSTEKDAVSLRDYTGDKDTLSYKRTAPKRVKDFPGMAKTELKLTRVNPTTGELVGIITVSTSIRADATAADKTAMMALSKAAADDAAWTDLVTDQRLPLATV
nr:MAG: coat protein [Leviviridae sp.]